MAALASAQHTSLAVIQRDLCFGRTLRDKKAEVLFSFEGGATSASDENESSAVTEKLRLFEQELVAGCFIDALNDDERKEPTTIATKTALTMGRKISRLAVKSS